MEKNIFQSRQAYRFGRFARKRYAVFNSLHRVISIGVVAGYMLAFAATAQTAAQNRLSTHSESSGGEQELDEVTVTSSEENRFGQTAKIVTVITRSEIERQPARSVQDLLRNVAGLDVRQRGANGVLAGVSVRGGTFEQTAILLNGVNLTNPQTGHYSLDLPVNLSDIERIEIIQGPASLPYGAGAFSGGINIITKNDGKTGVRLGMEGGMHSLFGANARGAVATSRYTHSISAACASSDGYIANSDYRILNALWQTRYRAGDAKLDLHLGVNDKEYGANTFYSAAYPNQFDDTQSLFAAVRGETGTKLKITPQLYWNRHYDTFHLFRPGTPDIPSWYSAPNYHISDVFGISLGSRYVSFAGVTGFGGEIRSESIASSNLGKDSISGGKYMLSDSRANISGFLEHTYRGEKFTFGAGILFNYNTAFKDDAGFFPSVSASFLPSDDLRIFASWNRAIRMPTFTDLYYSGATHESNSGARPEKSEAFEAGACYGKSSFALSLTMYYMKGIDLIDWVKRNPDDKWQSRNLTALDKAGFDASLAIFPGLFLPRLGSSRLSLGYAFMRQDKDAGEWISNYVLDYLRSKITVSLSHPVYRGLSADWRFRRQARQGTYTKYESGVSSGREEPYPTFSLLDLRLSLKSGRFTVYLLANNLFDVSYYDLGNIPQPGFWASAGVNVELF
ncbi:MAG: TonB-dependent receptor [Dysgonamonadaceae bacterium]|jgi:iron complex outermembrane receptor protein|nr:TonB-dependent receptor [Dysgonamonadaceae bacterium]